MLLYHHQIRVRMCVWIRWHAKMNHTTKWHRTNKLIMRITWAFRANLVWICMVWQEHLVTMAQKIIRYVSRPLYTCTSIYLSIQSHCTIKPHSYSLSKSLLLKDKVLCGAPKWTEKITLVMIIYFTRVFIAVQICAQISEQFLFSFVFVSLYGFGACMRVCVCVCLLVHSC